MAQWTPIPPGTRYEPTTDPLGPLRASPAHGARHCSICMPGQSGLTRSVRIQLQLVACRRTTSRATPSRSNSMSLRNSLFGAVMDPTRSFGMLSGFQRLATACPVYQEHYSRWVPGVECAVASATGGCHRTSSPRGHCCSARARPFGIETAPPDLSGHRTCTNARAPPREHAFGVPHTMP